MKESINTLLLVGGFIILFSVITKILAVTGIITYISSLLMFILRPFGFSKTMILPMISGIFEITNGANLVSQTQTPLLEQLIIVNAIIAWSGLSVHAQVATMINGTDINIKPYIFARIIQSLLAGITTLFFFIPLNDKISPAFSRFITTNNIDLSVNNIMFLIFIIFSGILIVSLGLSLIIYFIKKINIIFFHVSQR